MNASVAAPFVLRHKTALVLGILVLQNTLLILLMRYTLTVAGPRYLASTAVAMMEALKIVVCTAMVFMETGSYEAWIRKLRIEILYKPYEIVRLAVPSVLYTAQNNLLFIALANLDAATYSVCYQTKILTTALFSVFLLKKHLTRLKWFALFLLTAGVALAETASRTGEAKGSSDQSQLRGFMCVMLAACTSGFAGVYFEMILKGNKASLWIRNIQMGIPSIVLAFFKVLVADWAHVRRDGFFFGYTTAVVGVVVLQAAGGLVVAVVVKYTDNIQKSFAAAVSIVTSCIVSSFIFGFRPNGRFVLGLLFVCFSIFLYSQPVPPGQALPQYRR
ncbi:unnamed protein product, partial [Discosporangium mesarthrocarpum]